MGRILDSRFLVCPVLSKLTTVTTKKYPRIVAQFEISRFTKFTLCFDTFLKVSIIKVFYNLIIMFAIWAYLGFSR